MHNSAIKFAKFGCLSSDRNRNLLRTKSIGIYIAMRENMFIGVSRVDGKQRWLILVHRLFNPNNWKWLKYVVCWSPLQDSNRESKEGYKKSNLARQCIHREVQLNFYSASALFHYIHWSGCLVYQSGMHSFVWFCYLISKGRWQLQIH